jgi:hypothetical protein
MPEHRVPLRIIKAEARKPEGRGLDSDRFSVYLTLNRSLTTYERNWINKVAEARPLGIGGANPKTLPKTMLITNTTIEQVADARDAIKAFVASVESNGREAELEALDKADRDAAAAATEAQRRQAIADSIDWD